MFKGWFDINKPFWHWFSKIPEVSALSMLWILCCLPVVTILPASIALYDAISRGVMNEAGGYFRRFFSTFVKELKRGIPMTLLWGAWLLLLMYGETLAKALWEFEESAGYLLPVFVVLYLLYFGWLGWIVPLESRYFQGFFQLHWNSFRFMVGRLPYTGLLLLIGVAGVVLCIVCPLLIVLMPGAIAMGQCIFVEKVFKKLFPQDYEEDIFPPGPPETNLSQPLPPKSEE